MSEEYFDKDLLCFVHEVAYNYDRRLCTMCIGENSATDMNGAIRIAKRICPEVEQIQVYQVNKDHLDIVYFLDGKDWKARDARSFPVFVSAAH